MILYIEKNLINPSWGANGDKNALQKKKSPKYKL